MRIMRRPGARTAGPQLPPVEVFVVIGAACWESILKFTLH